MEQSGKSGNFFNPYANTNDKRGRDKSPGLVTPVKVR